ncbi:CD59 glycoprotein-like [Varanus komodoensis]|uniref:CD59 glycoprotein-like n=1 Tax=Varanus komodoensis TaxID=61221 RepID=UPI001CF7C598|nr:CD59 glycoprotein-like [Varanus komodoensis]
MKCFFITALMSIFILAFFSHSGSALKCFKCDSSPCSQNVTCQGNEDRCMVVYLGERAGRNISSCWEHANCNTDYIGKHFSSGTFKFRCCSRDLCNSSPVTTGSKIILGIASLLIIIQLVYF